MLGNFSSFFCHLQIFYKIYFFKKLFQEHYQSVKRSGGPDLDPNCLQRLPPDDKILSGIISECQNSLDPDCSQNLSAEDASRQRVTVSYFYVGNKRWNWLDVNCSGKNLLF